MSGRTESIPRTQLIGRSEVVDRVSAALLRPQPGAVLLTGDAGVGKTRLLHSIAEACASRGALVLHAVGLASQAATPMAAVADFVPPDLSGSPGRWSPRHALAARSQARVTVVCVDDVGLIDGASADLLAQCGAEAHVSLVMTTRTDAPAAALVDRIAHRHPLTVERVRPLTRDDTIALAEQLLGARMDGISAEQLWRLSGGNPLYLRHLVEHARRSAIMSQHGDVRQWHLGDASPAALRDLVGGVLDTLDAEGTLALELVALGEPVPRDVLLSIVAAETVDELTSRGILGLDRHAQTRVAHPLHREAVRANAGAIRSRRLLRMLAAAGRAHPPARQSLRTAHWRLQAGLEVPVAELRLAAQEALDRADPALAERFARAAAPDEPLAELCRALVAQNKVEEVESELGRPEHQARPDSCLTAVRALNLLWGLRRPEQAQAVLDSCSPETSARPELRIAQAALSVFGSSPDIHTDLLDGPDPDCPILTAAAATLRAYALTFAGRPQLAVDRFAAGDLAAPTSWPTMSGANAACHLHALLMSGHLSEARDLGASYYDAALGQGDHARLAAVCLERGVAAGWCGDSVEAHHWLAEARALAGRRLPFPIQLYIDAEYAATAAAIGQLGTANEALALAARHMPAAAGLNDHLEMARVRVLASGGRTATAAREAEPLVRRYLARRLTTNAAELLHYLVRLRPTRRTADRLREVTASCDGALLPLLADHADALVSRCPDALARVAERFADLGFIGLAEEASLASFIDGRGSAATSLTWREREVCELAADGVDNRGIAQHLGLSVRTVDNHLHRSYDKLAVSGRRQLPTALGIAGARPVAATAPAVP